MSIKTSAAADLPATETSPLLADVISPTTTQVPRYQLLILSWARVTQNWTYYTIFPFMPAFVRFIGVPEAQIGYNAGLVDSSLSLAQFLALMFWSRQSERHGRKPILCCCLAGLCASSLLFGFSTKMWHMILFRSISGIFSASSLYAQANQPTTFADDQQDSPCHDFGVHHRGNKHSSLFLPTKRCTTHDHHCSSAGRSAV